MKKRIIFAVTLVTLLLLTASPGFANYTLEGYIAALGVTAARPASVNRDDVRFMNVLTGEFICDYFATNKYNIIEIEPGDNFKYEMDPVYARLTFAVGLRGSSEIKSFVGIWVP